MQLPPYPSPSVSSMSTTKRDGERPTSSIHPLENSNVKSGIRSPLFPPSNPQQSPLVTIPENWATLDTVSLRLQPMTLSSGSNIRANNSSHHQHLTNQSFNSIKSNSSRLDSYRNRPSTHGSPKDSGSISSPKSHRRHHLERRQKQGDLTVNSSHGHHNALQQHLNAQRLTESCDSQRQSQCDEKNASMAVDDECLSDPGSEDSDSDSSDSSDGSRSASRSHSDNESTHEGDLSSDDEDSGSNASNSGRSGSSSSCSSDGEDDSSSSSGSSSQVIFKMAF